MLQLKITEVQVDLAMREGCIDKLTVIRRMSITLRGAHDIRSIDCRERGITYSSANWKQFWKYFKKIWIHKFKPECWNVNNVREDIVNRAKTPLERYNRT
ncbi:hypothetical protein PC128_g17476 [Phytophthora cactorum]|nr:hypothetical protein PC120_g15893 [Phytophthora cactorum]KAG3175965.1 hypothetical protein PC128_g17476 [Phytophthora cactorum]